MNDIYEQFIMPHVRDRLLAKWMGDIRELLLTPFPNYTRLHRSILCIRLAELITSGYFYLQQRVKELETENQIKFFTRLKDGVQQLVDSISDDEFMYLYNLRNHACHLFVLGYDIVYLNGNIKEGKDRNVQLPTKTGRQLFAIESIQNMFNETIKRFNKSDEEFVEFIYNKAKPIISSMYEDLETIFNDNN